MAEVDLDFCAVQKRALADSDRPPESPIRDDPAFDRSGWLRRHMADPVRARESTELYESLGFDVALRDLTPEDFGLQCRTCASAVCHSYVLIYTRKKGAAERSSRPSLPE